MADPAMPLTFHTATLADARNKARRQVSKARALLARGRAWPALDECLQLAEAQLESMTAMLDALDEQHGRTVKVLARTLARVDAALEDTE